MVFAALILCGLWLLQIVFLNSFYKQMKQNSVVNGAQQIVNIYRRTPADQMVEQMDQVAWDMGLFVTISDLYGQTIYSEDPTGKRYSTEFEEMVKRPGEVLYEKGLSYSVYQWILAQPNQVLFKYFDDSEDRSMFLYGQLLTSKVNEPAVLMITAQLQPMDDTVKILSQQLVIVTISVFVAALVLSIYLSNRIARPIVRITNEAKQLSSGNLDVTFEPGKYSEVTQLAHTLNYATGGLKQVDKLRAELIANVSHDLRTPLTMIKAYAEMIRDISGNSEEKRNKHLKVIIDESNRLTSLVQDLLDVSKLQAGVMEVSPAPFALEKLAKSVVEKFEVLRQQHGYEIQVSGAPVVVIADPLKIEQVLYNLISNAINYTGEDRKVFVSWERRGALVRVMVRDTGKGVAPEDMDHIWDRYYKVDKEHRRVVAGTGIGLSIVKSVLDLHHMACGVESEQGKGSVFWFELPVAETGKEIAKR